MTEKMRRSLNFQGSKISVLTAGVATNPTLLLIHGFPSSSHSFRNVIDELSKNYYLVAPDLPGFGCSDVVQRPSFSKFASIVEAILEILGIRSFHLYLHDYGAVVGLYLATRRPESIRSLIIQNANAHASGMGRKWAATRNYWENPSPETEAKATSHLTLDGTKYQYVGDIPEDISAQIPSQLWAEDWRVMSQPGHLKLQKSLILDYRRHVARFDEITNYLKEHQPPALLLWGRHDAFFDIKEVLSWMKDLPRMEGHILDGPHFLLETHADECSALITNFLKKVQSAV